MSAKPVVHGRVPKKSRRQKDESDDGPEYRIENSAEPVSEKPENRDHQSWRCECQQSHDTRHRSISRGFFQCDFIRIVRARRAQHSRPHDDVLIPARAALKIISVANSESRSARRAIWRRSAALPRFAPPRRQSRPRIAATDRSVARTAGRLTALAAGILSSF